MNKNAVLVALVLLIIAVGAYLVKTLNAPAEIPESWNYDENGQLIENPPLNEGGILSCTQDTDCSYIWYTGGCYNADEVAKQQQDAQERGIYYGEAAPRENVTCACVNGACVTNG